LKADQRAEDPLVGVPNDFTLLANGWIVPKKAAEWFNEACILGNWNIRKAKKGRRQQNGGRGMFAHLDAAAKKVIETGV